MIMQKKMDKDSSSTEARKESSLALGEAQNVRHA